MTHSDVLCIVTQHTDVTSDQLRSPSRVQNICEARHIAAYALHVMLGYSTTSRRSALVERRAAENGITIKQLGQ